MTTATNITIPCTPTTLTTLMQQWKASVADAPAAPAIAARPMSASEIAAFLNAASHDPDKISGLLLACTLLSGIPPFDLAAAEWDLYNGDAGKIEVCDEEVGYYATYQLSLPALEMVQATNLPTLDVSWVFHRNGEPICDGDLVDAFDRITMNAGIQNLEISDLVMAYEYVVLFAALFDVPLTPQEVQGTSLSDAGHDARPFVDDMTWQIHFDSSF